MIRHMAGTALLLLTTLLCSPAQATHIQYVDIADTTGTISADINTLTIEFDLLTDEMHLWDLDSPTTTAGGGTPGVNDENYLGLFEPDYDLHFDSGDVLHYVYLRIDPNNVNIDGSSGNESTSDYISVMVNGTAIDPACWTNPIFLYGWGVPGSNVSDAYGIAANNYKIVITLTGQGLPTGETINITNINLEGCFDTAMPVPEPASMLLFGSGLIGLACLRRRTKKA